MAVSISQRYNKKKRDTLSKRSVGFELTLEEFKTLYSKSDVCDYTGETFSTSSIEYHKSIERIDKNLPYRRDNCCVVTVKANQLKDMLEEDRGRLKVQDLELFNKIKETLESKTRQQLVNKYFPDVKIGENNEEQMNTEKQNIDVSIAQSYLDIGKQFDNFCMSFSGYKKLYIRKTCMLTKKSFNNSCSNMKRAFLKKDENKPWNDINTMIVCNIVKTIRDSGLSEKDLKNVYK